MSAFDDIIMDDDYVAEALSRMKPLDKIAAAWQIKWLQTAHKHQIEPLGDFGIWLMLAGRGAGKTRAAAETLGQWAWENPNTR